MAGVKFKTILREYEVNAIKTLKKFRFFFNFCYSFTTFSSGNFLRVSAKEFEGELRITYNIKKNNLKISGSMAGKVLK